MKKKLLILGMIPLLALTSCGGRGPKVDEEKAKDITSAIHEYNTKKEGQEESQSAIDYEGFDMVMNVEGSSGEGDAKKKETLKYKLTVNQGDETRFEGHGTDGEEKIDFLIISVKPEGYEKNINYLRAYNNETKEYDEFAIPSNQSNSTYTNYSFQILIVALMLAKYQDPVSFMQKEKENEEHEMVKNDDYLFEYDSEELEAHSEEKWEFYSKGDGNLTIVASTEYKGTQTTFEKETMLKTNYEIAYNKSIIKSVKANAKSNLGNEMKISMNVNARKEPFKIELPSGWEKKVLPDSSIPVASSQPESSSVA